MLAKKFVYRALLFILIPLPAVFYLDYVVTKGLQISHNRLYYAWSDIYNSKVKSKLWIMGSSRAFAQLSTPVIDSVLQTDSYNLGVDGYSFSMEYCRLKMALQYNKKPKYIIQVMDLHTLNDRKDLYAYQQFLPYLNDTIITNGIKQYKESFNWLQIKVPLYRYSGAGFLIFEGVNNYIRNRPTVDAKFAKNYSPGDLPWDGAFDAFKKANPNGIIQEVNSETQARFESYLKYCQANTIKLTLVYPPDYHEFQPIVRNRAQILALYTRYATQYNIPFFDYSNHYLSKSKKYYYNSQHLNKRGAEIFSRILSKDLGNQLDTRTLNELKAADSDSASNSGSAMPAIAP